MDFNISKLSINDSFNHDPKDYEGNNDDSFKDNMDIDSVKSFDDSEVGFDSNSVETLKLTPIKCSTPINNDHGTMNNHQFNESHYEIDDENSSFVSALSQTLFSPTNIGANYALKMLPAPTPTSQPETSLVRHINSFSNSDISVFDDEFVYNPQTNDYDAYESSIVRKVNQHNSADQVHQLEKFNNSINNHSTVNSTIATTDFRTPEKTIVHHHHYYYSPNLTNVDGSLVSYKTANEIILPPPWEASTKDKYSYIISTYLQLIINFLISFYGIYLIFNIIKTIRKDINFKLINQSTNILIEIDSCRKNYYENNCSPDLIVPALEKPCEYWLKCMNQDPQNFGNASSISAETLGMILNSLIEPLGIKFFLVFFGFISLIFGLNFMFGFIRAKSYYNFEQDGKKPI